MAQIEAEKARITDKMPHNFQHVGFILALFPNARVIFCKRNALDNCTWIFTSPLNEEHAYKNTLEDLGRYYLAHNRLRQHWLQMDPERVFDLQYEPLITDFEPTVRKLFAFIDMPFEDGTLDFYRSGRVVNTISRNQVTKPLYSSAMGRWRAFEAELAPLRAIVGDD